MSTNLILIFYSVIVTNWYSMSNKYGAIHHGYLDSNYVMVSIPAFGPVTEKIIDSRALSFDKPLLRPVVQQSAQRAAPPRSIPSQLIFPQDNLVVYPDRKTGLLVTNSLSWSRRGIPPMAKRKPTNFADYIWTVRPRGTNGPRTITTDDPSLEIIGGGTNVIVRRKSF